MSFQSLNLPSTRFSKDERIWPTGSIKIILFGQQVLFRDVRNGGRHISKEDLDVYRQQGDNEVDEILDLLEKEGRPLKATDDILAAADEILAATDENNPMSTSEAEQAVAKFLKKYSELPSWADLDQIRQGQEVYLAYTGAISLSLFYRSLVPGFSIPKIAAVLKSTGYLAPPAGRESVQNRLIDTGAMIAACLAEDLNGILAGGVGWKAAIQVRFLHAKIRRVLLQRSGKRAWDTDRLGVPINQEDMAATLLAFSVNSLLGCEMIIGAPLAAGERRAFLAFWRYIGWLLGVDCCQDNNKLLEAGNDDERSHAMATIFHRDKPLPLDPCGPGWYANAPDSLEHSYAVFQSIIVHIMQPDETSVEISHHLLKLGRPRKEAVLLETEDARKQAASDENWFYFRSLQCRRFVGYPLADALQLPLHPVWYKRWRLWMISSLYLWILRVYTWAALPFSLFRRRIIRFHRRKMVEFVSNWRKDPEKEKKDGECEQNDQPANKDGKSDKGDNSTTIRNNSSCPFAMVAPPKY